MTTSPRDGCTFGWVIVANASIPTVAPCPRHRPGVWKRWKAGAYMPKPDRELEVVR